MITTNKVLAQGLVVEFTTARGVIRTLDCPEFIVNAGESVAVMGPSGCGKSTLLGLLAGLAIPTKGSVNIGETVTTALSEPDRVRFRKQNIGVVYQADNLLPFLTVVENIQLQLALCEDTKDASGRIHELLDKLGLQGLGKRLPDQLSGGQRQRVAIARAIIHKPAVILADEPTGALDDKNASNVVELLLDNQYRLHSTLILVTHDPKIAKKMQRTFMLRSNQDKFIEQP